MNADLNGLSESVIGCAYRVSSSLGSGFLESVYENALALEFGGSGIVFERQKRLIVRYRDAVVGDFAADFLIADSIIVELKAVKTLLPEHQAQVLNYLKASGLQLGLLINFGTPKAQIKRLVHQLRSD
ncbi:MAG: GxxExxY protein [Wenzhouxiangellaceae bacterium]|nr:GxxExxY protein [Wenzhouxiangellaceae bacterium]